MANLIINWLITIVLIVIIIIQPSYTNDQTHSLINPTDPVFSRKEINTMKITGVITIGFILIMLFQI